MTREIQTRSRNKSSNGGDLVAILEQASPRKSQSRSPAKSPSPRRSPPPVRQDGVSRVNRKVKKAMKKQAQPPKAAPPQRKRSAPAVKKHQERLIKAATAISQQARDAAASAAATAQGAGATAGKKNRKSKKARRALARKQERDSSDDDTSSEDDDDKEEADLKSLRLRGAAREKRYRSLMKFLVRNISKTRRNIGFAKYHHACYTETVFGLAVVCMHENITPQEAYNSARTYRFCGPAFETLRDCLRDRKPWSKARSNKHIDHALEIFGVVVTVLDSICRMIDCELEAYVYRNGSADGFVFDNDEMFEINFNPLQRMWETMREAAEK